MHTRDKIDVAVCIGSLRSELSYRSVRISTWIQPIDAIVAELAADDETRVGIITFNLHKLGDIAAAEFHSAIDLAMVLAGIDRIERMLVINPCVRNIGLADCDDGNRSRLEQIFGRAKLEFAERRRVA